MLSPQQAIAAQPRLDFDNQCLWRGDERIVLTPKGFRVLQYLVEHRDQLVTKEALLKAVWPRTAVETNQVKQFVAELRRLLGDDSHVPRYIETVRGRGYRFIGQLERTVQARSYTSLQTPAGALQESTLPGGASGLLVSRHDETQFLQARFNEALTGRACICLVTGETGIGKTALLVDFVNRAVAARAPWILRGQCVESLQRVEPLLPILSALESLSEGLDSSVVINEMRRVAPLWLRQIPGLVDAAELERLRQQCEDASQARMMREFARLIDALACHHPVIIWLEDLHWADESTLHLIAHLVSQSRLRDALLVGTSLPIESLPSDHLLRRLPSMVRVRQTDFELALGGIAREGVRQYLDKRWPDPDEGVLPGVRRRNDLLAERIHTRSEGHPYFMVKLAEHYNDPDLHTAVTDQTGMRDGDEIPRSLHLFIEEQFAILDTQAVLLLEVAAVAGRDFSSALVAAVLGLDTDLVETQCEQLARGKALLTRTGVREWPDGTIAGVYGFVHRLYRQALLARIPGYRHARLHQLLGERLERAYGERCDEVAFELSHHFRQCRDEARVRRYTTMMRPHTGARYFALSSAAALAGTPALAASPIRRERGIEGDADGM